MLPNQLIKNQLVGVSDIVVLVLLYGKTLHKAGASTVNCMTIIKLVYILEVLEISHACQNGFTAGLINMFGSSPFRPCATVKAGILVV